MRYKSGLLIMMLAGVMVSSSGALAAIAPFSADLMITGDAPVDVGSSTGTAISPVTGVDRSEVAGLSFATAIGNVPAGTRSVEIARAVTHLSGAYHEGYDDTLSLKLMAVPLPSAFVLFASGLSLIPWALWWQGRAKCTLPSALY